MKKAILSLVVLSMFGTQAQAQYGYYRGGGTATTYPSVGGLGPTTTYYNGNGISGTATTYPSVGGLGPTRTYYNVNGVSGTATTYPSVGGLGPSRTYYSGF